MNDDPELLWAFDDPDRPLCCELSAYGFRCTLPIHHDGLHVAVALHDQPVDRWASRV